jgi:hypothetical protein
MATILAVVVGALLVATLKFANVKHLDPEPEKQGLA